jgi:hypothetical protein
VKLKNSSRTRKATFLALAIVAGIGTGVAGVTIAQASDQPTNRSQMAAPAYPKNASGQTYGSAAEATTPQNEPDLILVVATNGKTGYAKRTDLDPKSAANPAQAVAAQKANAASSAVRAPVPVYESDGKTVIGEFAFSAAGSTTTTK